MKNLFIIIVLCVFHCGCSRQMPQPQQGRTLLEFSDLTGEIAVSHETLTSTPAESQADAERTVDSS